MTEKDPGDDRAGPRARTGARAVGPPPRLPRSTRYRHDGLRLLTAGGGRPFFLHDGWKVQEGKVVVLPDDGSVRVEYGGRSTGA
jgi:hypothetical protein